jgi:uncharacterized coiled-coil DUF342 family protein
MSNPIRERLVAEIDALRAENTSFAGEIERLSRRVDELTHRLGKGSKNSSRPVCHER